MVLRVLRYFLTIANEGSISKAAQALRITQPTLSRQIQELEAELSVCLFHRGKKRIKLSEEGMLFRQRAFEIVALSDKVKDEFIREYREPEGKIGIGCAETKGSKTLAKKMAAFQRMYPKVTFDLYNADSNGIKQRLQEGLLDIGLLLEPVDKETYAYIRLPKKEIWGVVMTNDDPLASQSMIRADELEGKALILPSRREVKQEVLHWLGKSEDEIQDVCSHHLFSNVTYLVEENMGYCITIDGVLGLEHNPKLTFVPLMPSKQTESVLVWKRDRPLSSIAKMFVDFFADQIRKEEPYD